MVSLCLSFVIACLTKLPCNLEVWNMQYYYTHVTQACCRAHDGAGLNWMSAACIQNPHPQCM